MATSSILPIDRANMTRKCIQIGDFCVGDGHPTLVIAEIGNNHNGSVSCAKKLVDAAKAAGADFVKFQKRHLPDLYTEKYLDNPNTGEHGLHYMLPVLRDFELGINEFCEVIDYCKQIGMPYLVTAWDRSSADFVEQLPVPAYKIASADMTNLELIQHVVLKQKPLIVSTGMSTEEEVVEVVAFLEACGAEYVLLHCNSTYPAPVNTLNLRYIQRLRQLSASPVGYSGHELGTLIGAVAVGVGAVVLERHITLDRDMEGPDHKASLDPEAFVEYVAKVRLAEQALGSYRKVFVRGEVLNREVLGKSVAASVSIPKGTQITREMLAVIGPGKGVSPLQINAIIGSVARRHYNVGDFFVDGEVGERRLPTDSRFPWGFKGRYDTLEELVSRYKLQLFELHMSDEDAYSEWVPSKQHSDTRLFLHVTEYMGRRMLDLCTAVSEHRESSIALVQQNIERARQLEPYFAGTPGVIFHVGGMTVESEGSGLPSSRLLDNLRGSLDRLDFAGVELFLENLPPRPWYFGGQWIQRVFADATEIAEFLKSTNLSFCFDCSHAMLQCNLAGTSLADYARIVQPWTQHLHISDAAGTTEEGLQIGEGEIDFAGLFSVLGDAPCSLVPEIWRGHLNDAAGFLVGIERLAPYLT